PKPHASIAHDIAPCRGYPPLTTTFILLSLKHAPAALHGNFSQQNSPPLFQVAGCFVVILLSIKLTQNNSRSHQLNSIRTGSASIHTCQSVSSFGEFTIFSAPQHQTSPPSISAQAKPSPISSCSIG